MLSKCFLIFTDELLEDLQSTVAPRPIANGNATTGYRQTYKTYSTQKSGYPAETSRECEIEYLNPSNTTSVITERSKSPFFDKVTFSTGECSFFLRGGGNLTILLEPLVILGASYS